MKLSDFTMQEINIALDGQPKQLGEWKTGSRGCLIGEGVMSGKRYQVKIHASEPKWYLVAEEINRVKAELAAAPEEDKARLQSELDTLKNRKSDRDKRDAIADQFLDMRKRLMSSLNAIGTSLIVANADVWKQKVEKRGNKTFAIEATPWVENIAVGLTPDDDKPLKFTGLPTDKQYKIVASLADVLSKVHAKGIIHGDLKIGNTLIVNESGEFKVALIDYDAAYILDDLHRGKYEPGAWFYVLGGTFIAPEIWGLIDNVTNDQDEEEFKNFDKKLVTDKSDIFSLGVTIYEYFYGRADGTKLMPFVGPAGEVLDENLYGLALNSGYKLNLPDTIPDFLYGMFNWMLAVDPADRPTAVQVRDAFASANVNMIPAQFLRNPLWEEHCPRYELKALPAGVTIAKASRPSYRVRRDGLMVTRKIDDLVKEGYVIDHEGTAPEEFKGNPNEFWPQDGEGKLPICVMRARVTGQYQMSVKGIMKVFTYAQLREQGVICSEAEMRTPWPCDTGLKFNRNGIVRDLGLGKGPGHYKIGEGLAAIRRTAKEMVNAGDAFYGVTIKLHPRDAEQYTPNPAAVPADVSHIYPDPMQAQAHGYIVYRGKAMSKMTIDEMETKGYVKVK